MQQLKKLKRIFYCTTASDSHGILPVLNMRVGERHLSFGVSDHASGQLHELSYWTTDELNGEELASLFREQTALKGPFYQVKICYDHPGGMLVPATGIRQEDAILLQKTLPSAADASLSVSERLAEWQLYNVYSVPGDIHERLLSKFPGARFWHESTVGLKNIQAGGNTGVLRADFRHHDFSLIAVRAGQVLLARSFGYTTPEDVLYYLVRACRQYALVRNEVSLELSGLVDRQSALYNELYQYFSRIGFRDNRWILPGNDYPAHYFTSLNDLAQCV